MVRWLTILIVGKALAADGPPDLPKVIELVGGGYRSADAMQVMRDVYANDRYFTFPTETRDSMGSWCPQKSQNFLHYTGTLVCLEQKLSVCRTSQHD